MAKRTSTVETACPHCGHSPIGESDVRCPGCMRLLREVNVGTFRHNDREVSPDLDVREGTRLGGFDLLTSDAEAHPGTMALALATLGLYAGAGGLALLTLPGELNGYLVLGCANLALAIALFSLPGFARPLVIVSAPIQALAWCWLGREVLPSPAVLGVGLAPLLILAGVSGATGPRRRSLVLAAVLGATTFATTSSLAARGLPGPRLEAAEQGLTVQLPSGFRPVAQADELASYLPLDGLDPRLQTFGFVDPLHRIGGFVSIGQVGLAPTRLAEALVGGLDEASPPRLAHDDATRLPGSGQVDYEVGLGGGRVASSSAIKLDDGRTAALVVAGPPQLLAQARRALARGVSFRAPAASDRH